MIEEQLTITLDGVTKTMAQWAEETGISYSTLWTRYQRGVRGAELFSKSLVHSGSYFKKAVMIRELWRGKWVYVGTQAKA